jgi:hypothetical protein
MNNNDFDDIIKQKADDHQAPVPTDAWDNIANKKRKNPYPIFWFSLSSLLMAGIFLVYIYTGKMNNSIIISQKILANNSSNSSKSIANNNQITTPNSKDYISGTNSVTDRSLSRSGNNNLYEARNGKQNSVTNRTGKIATDLLSTAAIERKAKFGRSIASKAVTSVSVKPAIAVNDISGKAPVVKTSVTYNATSTVRGHMLPVNRQSNNDKHHTATANNNIGKDDKEPVSNTNTKSVFESAYLQNTRARNRSNRSVQRKLRVNIKSPVSVEETETAYAYNKTGKKKKYNYTIRGKERTTITDPIQVDNTVADSISDVVPQTEKVISFVQHPPIIDSPLIKKQDKNIDSLKKDTQNKKPVIVAIKKRQHSLLIDISVIPFLPIRNFNQLSTISRVDNNKTTHSTYQGATEKTSLQFSAGFAVCAKTNINKRLVVGAGIQFSEIKENVSITGTEMDTTYSPIQRLAINTNGYYLKNDTTLDISVANRIIKATNSYRVFSIPLFATYTFLNYRSFSASVTGGICFNIAQYHNTINGLQYHYANGKNSNNSTGVTTDILGGVRFGWSINKKYQLFAEPGFRYSLNRYALKNTVATQSINQVGMSMGITYRFR